MSVSFLEDDLSTFRYVLKSSIEMAIHSMMIVSPFISIKTIEADNLEPLLKEAVARGVQIKVYTDANLDFKNSHLKPNADAGRKLLQHCGVELIVVQGVHCKTLCVDDCYLVEGSFNWLSASRDPASPYARYEVSSAYRGNTVAEYINKAVKQMETIAKKK